jgi:hypothetical protein
MAWRHTERDPLGELGDGADVPPPEARQESSDPPRLQQRLLPIVSDYGTIKQQIFGRIRVVLRIETPVPAEASRKPRRNAQAS